MSKTYDAAVAQQLLELAFAGWEHLPFEIRPDGIFQSDAHREASPADEVFDWTPAYDMAGDDAPNPLTAPALPLPFTAAELAAFMLDGAGAMIPDALECRLGGDVAQSAMLPKGLRHRSVREALQEAYALAAQAIGKVGEFDYEEEARAHALVEQYDEANGQANKREGVFETGTTEDERRVRRVRAVASVAGLKEQALLAQREVKTQWFAWREAIVRCLLADEAPDSAQQEAAFFEGFYSDSFDLHQWASMSNVTPSEAAQFLNGKNPLQAPDDAKTQMLARVFEDVNRLNPANRTMLDWLAVARSRGADYDEGAANFVEVNTRVENTPQAAAPKQETTEAPSPLTTGDIAFCFDGLRWSEKQWRKPLGNKPKWLQRCIVMPGQQGVREATWNPVFIAGWLVRNGHVRAKSARAKFQTNPRLAPWRDAWDTYEAEYLDSD